jgi:hypothetical protein
VKTLAVFVTLNKAKKNPSSIEEGFFASPQNDKESLPIRESRLCTITIQQGLA